jgi:hypothetical protein
MRTWILLGTGLLVLGLAGCSSTGSTATDLGDPGPDGTSDLDVLLDVADAAPDADDLPDVPEVPGDVLDASDTPWDFLEPWTPPVEAWSTCTEKDYVGGVTLHDKAAYYDWIVPRLHQVPATAPGHETWSGVFAIECDGDVPATVVPDADLPACRHPLSENTGLWTSLYVASQAFRYATTRDAESLNQLRRTLNGTYQMLQITGKAGLYTRDLRDPKLAPQQYCIEAEEPYASAATDNEKYARYIPPGEGMVGNQFVRVDTDGCFLTWDVTLNGGNGGWLKDTAHCTDTRFAGYCWQRNASKDEYAGHMFAAGIAAKLVDDPEVRALAVGILGAVGRHLVDNAFWINDYDGRKTRYGSAHAMSLDEMPGSNALMALAWIKEAAVATGDAGLTATYNDCLLQLSGELACIDQPMESPLDYREYLDSMGLAQGCDSNYDTISIAMLNYFNLIWYEADPALRAFYRDKFRANTKGPDSAGRDLWGESDPFKNLILVSTMEPGAYDAAEVKPMIAGAVCSLKRFPTDNILRAKDATGYAEWCQSARHGSLAAEPVPVDERCASVFVWWGDPNARVACGQNLKAAEPPASYLLPYWMGRYFGYIGADL